MIEWRYKFKTGYQRNIRREQHERCRTKKDGTGTEPVQ